MSRNRATRPLIKYSLCSLRYNRRLTTTSPGFVTSSGLSAFFFLFPFRNAGPSVATVASPESKFCSAELASLFSVLSALRSASCPATKFTEVLRSCAPSSFSAPSITNLAASASSGSSIVIVTSASPIGGRFTVPLKMQSLIRPARRLLWLCSPSTHEIASTTLDFPHPFGPTIHVVPIPLNVTTVRSQNDLNPVISTFLSLSKVSPLVSSRLPARKGQGVRARRETAQYSPIGGVFSQHPNRVPVERSPQLYLVEETHVWQVLCQRPSRLALQMAVRVKNVSLRTASVKHYSTACGAFLTATRAVLCVLSARSPLSLNLPCSSHPELA